MIASSAPIDAEAAGPIIERAMAGDEVAFARIVAAHNEDMARISYLVSGSLDVAEDAVQAAWAIAWRRLSTLRDPARLRPWLMSVAANEARQMTRGNRRRSHANPPEGSSRQGGNRQRQAGLSALQNDL